LQSPVPSKYAKVGDSAVTYLGVFGAIGAANSVFSLARAFLFAYAGIRAAKSIHRLDLIG